MDKNLQSCSTEDSGEDEKGTSLFHQRLSQRRMKHPDEEMRFLLQRLIVVGRLSCGLADRQVVGDHYEKLNLSLLRRRVGEDVTGLLLLYPQHALHIIECSTETLPSVLQDLRHMEETPESAPILEPRILLVSHDPPSRLFPQWNYVLLNESDSSITLSSEDQNTDRLVRETLSQVLQLGCHLHKVKDQITGCKIIPDDVLKNMSELIPPPAAVSQLAQMEMLLSPAQYIRTYRSPLHVNLDSDPVCSAVKHLFK